MANLLDHRLVFVGNADGITAVGDYSQNFIEGVRPHFGDVVEFRTGGPGDYTLAGVRELRRAVRAAVEAEPSDRVLVHAELSAGALGPFWATFGLKDVVTTATVHDPPQGVWWPARTTFMAKHRLAMHGLHYPLRPLSRWLEGISNADRTLFALTETGRRSIERTYPRTSPVYIPHLVAPRPPIAPAAKRPKAVGFFGNVYRGKGFEQIARIRAALPPDIAIRIAGRGTEALPAARGIDVVGGVDGSDEDEFFASVRAIVVPDGRRHFYAETYPASGVVAHAMAYRTPVVCTSYGSLAELSDEDGAVVVNAAANGAGEVAEVLASEIASLIEDEARTETLAVNVARAADDRSAARTADRFVETWVDLLDRRKRYA